MATKKKEKAESASKSTTVGKKQQAKVESASTSTSAGKQEHAKSSSTVTTVGRQELAKRIAQQTKLPQKQVSEVLEAALATIREALQNGDEVRLVGFGSFKVRQSAARRGVNPRDRKPIEVPAKERVRFTPGKDLAEAVVKK